MHNSTTITTTQPSAIRIEDDALQQVQRTIICIGLNNSDLCSSEVESLLPFDFHTLNNRLKVYFWIENKLNTEEDLPFAIICSLDFLEQDNFKLLQKVKENPLGRHIPFILVSTQKRKQVDLKFLLRQGIDDFYILPLEWEFFNKRIEFLSTFKQDISAKSYINTVAATTSDTSVAILPQNKRTPIQIGKRLFDIVVASSLILVLSPVLLTIALLVKLDSPGPVIYRSKRAGRDYKVFDFYKFRSMRQGADKELNQLNHLNVYYQENQEKNNSKISFHKFNNDPRVTRLGSFIRRTSIDELPQLFNVLKGDMSIVGNRPLPLYEAEQLTTDYYAKRFLAPAGITGLWQISKGRNEGMSSEERVQLDIEYAENWSFSTDLKVLLQTPLAAIQKSSV